MSVLRDAGDAAKGDQRGRKGGFKSKQSILDSVSCIAILQRFALL
jgi:hypothetical protein